TARLNWTSYSLIVNSSPRAHWFLMHYRLTCRASFHSSTQWVLVANIFMTRLLTAHFSAPYDNEAKARQIVQQTSSCREPDPMEQKKSIWELLKSSVTQWLNHQPFQMASSLAYYTIFSLAPLLIIVIAIAGSAFGKQATEQQIFGRLQRTIGPQGAEAIQG